MDGIARILILGMTEVFVTKAEITMDVGDGKRVIISDRDITRRVVVSAAHDAIFDISPGRLIEPPRTHQQYEAPGRSRHKKGKR